jgi:hypothetical protein
MIHLVKEQPRRHEHAATLQESVTYYLDDRFGSGSLMPAFDDLSSQRIIALESRVKLALTIESNDPVEFAYQNLIREIDTEAKFGILLSSPAGKAAHLLRSSGKAGRYGNLHKLIAEIGPVLFAEEYYGSGRQLDQVLIGINSRYDRANLEAEVSELILIHLLGDADEAANRADELRALFYAYHEDSVRRRFDLAPMQSTFASRRLADDVRNLTDRAGDYAERVAAIRERAGTA